MKRKMLALGVLSLCALGMFTSESTAFLGLFNPYNPHSFANRHNRYVTQITCRPYNAFTPICWGNLVCDGCCPSPCGVAGGCLPMNMGVPPFASCGSYMPYMGGMGCPDGGYASDMGAPPMPLTSYPPSFQPPLPMPVGPGTTMAYPPLPSGVAQAHYNPTYAPQYYYPNYYMPTYYNPYPQPTMPYYWYGSGR